MKTTLAILALLVMSTAAHAADKPVPKRPTQSTQPYKACLTQAQAREVYPGKHLKYREVQREKCWFAGATLPKSAFIPRNPRATGVAVIPARQSSTEQQRVQVAPAGSIPAVGTSIHRTEFTATLENDRFLALTGAPERFFTFDAYWNLMTGWNR